MPAFPFGTLDYVVKPGDTLSKIVKDYNTTVEITRKFNNIPNPNYILAGSTIMLVLSPPEAIIYIVRPGDTLYSIARKYGTLVKNLVDFNYLDNPNLIYPGEHLVVTASLR
jgi:LysM repeat protein